MRRMLAGAILGVTVAGCGVSTQQEVDLGANYAQQINSQLPIVQDPEINRYINVLGDSIARLTQRSELPWQFFIVNSAEVNAFAVPGGFIYFTRGILPFLDNEAELAGVMGHEVGHVTARHSDRKSVV